jgi:hypothetical protein
VLSQPSRYFAIPADQLRAALRRDGELRAHIETCFAGTVMQKLKTSKQALARYALVAAPPSSTVRWASTAPWWLRRISIAIATAWLMPSNYSCDG